MTGDGVDEGGDHEAQDQVGHELGALGDGAGDDGHGRGGEDALEEPVGVGPKAFGRIGGRLGQAEVGKADEASDVRAEHERVAEQEEGDGAGGEVEHVLHEDVAGVFRPGEPGFDHGETGLHEHDEDAGNERPDGVAVHDAEKLGLGGRFLGQGQGGQRQEHQRRKQHGFVKILPACHKPPFF